jgi:hypothetical protein
MDKDFLEKTHTQILEELKTTSPSNLTQAVLCGALLSEYLIKESLSAVCPIAPYSLQYLHNAHADFAALLKKTGVQSSKIKYEDIGVLLDRAKALECVDARAIELIGAIKTVRNNIIHDLRSRYDRLEAHARLLELFMDYASLFETYLGIKLNDDYVQQLSITRKDIERQIDERLENKIKHAMELYDKLTPTERSERIDHGAADIIAEGSIIESMLCPACNNNTLGWYYFVDADYNYDGIIYNCCGWFECPVCELHISEYDFENLFEEPQKYTKRQEADESWLEYFDHKHLQENAYEFM